jgi:hypothetical protein
MTFTCLLRATRTAPHRSAPLRRPVDQTGPDQTRPDQNSAQSPEMVSTIYIYVCMQGKRESVLVEEREREKSKASVACVCTVLVTKGRGKKRCLYVSGAVSTYSFERSAS